MVESKPQVSQPSDPIGNMNHAELERLVTEIVQKTIEQQQNSYEAMIEQIKQKLAQPYDTSAPSLLDIARELAAQVPPEEWAEIPKDASQNYRDYLYNYKNSDHS